MCTHLITSFILIYATVPLFKRLAYLLTHTTPKQVSSLVDKALSQVSTLQGVIEHTDFRMWSFLSHQTFGTLRIFVEPGVDKELMLRRVQGLFRNIVKEFTISIDTKHRVG